MQEIAEHTCAAFSTECEFEFRRNYPPTINHPAETEFARRVLSDLVGEANVAEFEPTMGAEDFSYYLLEKPGCFFMIANGDGSHRDGGHGMGPCMLPTRATTSTGCPLGGTSGAPAERWLAAARGRGTP
jgi:hippurate hydrolase